ncbi:filamentous hemagglutinin family protein [Variovorax boronicumulans]|uniref:Filamentous hemagglutinin family protein n=2 Tax=Pseudomonadota TaxID=1224 RepID=A0AAW8DNZ0_9BURK|nr:filamentous haemagglutinin family protein [Variovorax boronicumulans]MDP9875864.1 filamentous hemagglutinin family protein [Variovorax boronicumulans]MDP9921147.1 filamentous hemagglutinin family protein [Variovorax boronicumulans]
MQRSSRRTVSRRNPPNASSSSSSAAFAQVRLTPLVRAIALLLAGGAAFDGAQAQQAFSGAWMAQKNMAQSTALATGRLPNGLPAAMLAGPQAQQQRANEQLQQSLGNLNLAARAIAAQQSAQAAARAAAQHDPSVPDGLAEGGLKVDTNALTAGWHNARPLTTDSQRQAAGRTVVTVEQTADKAILNWETFNVGRNTTVKFDQQASWSVLNRVNDPKARPSQIQGQIQADGTVMVVNRNGIVFSGSSQVDTRNLVAAAVGMSDAQFKRGLYSETRGSTQVPVLANDLVLHATGATHGAATADVVVEPGARIATRRPTSVTEGGGYVLLAGREAHNHGSITTANGQTVLAAGDAFVIRKGMGTDGNSDSSTRGNEVDPLRLAGSAAGRVRNTGLIAAPTGDVTLVGKTVEQQGVLLSSSSVNTRGTLHLRAVGEAGEARVTLAPQSTSAIVLENDGATALDVQRDTLLKDSMRLSDGGYNRRDQSLVKIDSAGDIDFDGGSLTLATGGQVQARAERRTRVASGAAIDVAGAVGVGVAMASNNVKINVQGNEQRDAPLNRDGKRLNNLDMWIDRRDLVRVAAGVNGYAGERWYTGGGLLEVGGYLNTDGHTVGEWAASGGTVAFAGGELVTQRGSRINVAGGTLDVQTGRLQQSWLKGPDGRLYNLSTAPADIVYTGLYRGFEDEHARWGKTTTGYFYNPLIAPRERLENGYTVGRDAGQVQVGTRAAVLEGDIDATVFQGERQQRKRDAGLDSYRQLQTAAPLAGRLVIGGVAPVYDAATGLLRDNPSARVDRVTFAEAPISPASLADALAAGEALPKELAGHVRIDSQWLQRQRLGGVVAYANDTVAVTSALAVAPGGSIALHAPTVAVDADLVARGGSIALGDLVGRFASANGGSWVDISIADVLPVGYAPRVAVGEGVRLDARGLWSHIAQSPDRIEGLPYVDGGQVTLRSTGDVVLGARSLVDVSGGAALLAGNELRGGRGGDVTLMAAQPGNEGAGPGTLRMDGEVRGHGVKGGGKLTLANGAAIGIGELPAGGDGQLAAGRSSTVHLRLAGDYVIAAGSEIPMDFAVTVSRALPGEALKESVQPGVSNARTVITGADWVVPPGTQAFLLDGKGYEPGQTVPAGSVLAAITLLAQGYVLPRDVFPSGLPIPPKTTSYKAGTVAAADTVMPAGTPIVAGTALPRAVAVQPLLRLDTDLFRSGFAQYTVRGQDGVAVADGARVEVRMPVQRFDPVAGALAPTGADPSTALPLWMPPVYQDDPVKQKLTQRAGADLTLEAGTLYQRAPLVVGEGAHIALDPGRTLTLRGNDQITVDGTLSAWGGRVALLPGDHGMGNARNLADGMPNARSYWIGEHALIDVAARPVVATDARGHRYGQVANGGTIEIGGRHVLDATQVDAADAFVVLRPGARLEASGTSATLDLPGRGATEVASHGGTIALSSFRGLFLDGDLRAAAGGAGAAGGMLALNLDTPIYGTVARYNLKGENVDDAVRVPREMLLAQVQGRSAVADAAGLRPGQAHGALAYGAARIGVDRIHDGGFDNLSLLSHGMLSFDGSVDLSLGQSLRLTTTALALAEASAPDARVALAAPYIRLAASGRTQIDDYILPNPVLGSRNAGGGAGTLGVPLVSAGSSLRLDAQLIDLAGMVQQGVRGTIVRNVPEDLVVERNAFDHTLLRSSGDLRLSNNARFYVPGDLTLAAAQIYPATGDSGLVQVGQRNVIDKWGTRQAEMDMNRRLVIERVGDTPAMPQSAFGSLTFHAAHIEQRGVLRAPLGGIALGSVFGDTSTSTVQLHAGSLTSVSADGLLMPYGGTQDGLTYLFNGKDVAYRVPGVGPAITLSGHAVDVREGAVLDMSGGGTLTGTAFLAGRGGSTDARMHPLVQVGAQRKGFVLPGLATNPVYAIVPGVQPLQAPLGAEKGASDPAVGRQITVGAGVPGLPPGRYTLMPSTYALLPGAFRVELNGLAAQVGAPGSATAMRNGSYTAPAQLGVAGTGIHDALPLQAVFTPGDVLRTYAQYNETGYADFAVAQALRDGVPRPLLERDAKALRFQFGLKGSAGEMPGEPALRFAGTARYATVGDGMGGTALVIGGTARSFEVLGDGAAPTPDFKGTSLHARDLNAIGAAQLAIGGAPAGTFVQDATAADRLRDANRLGFSSAAEGIVLREGAVLRAGEVFLVTDRRDSGITVESGAGIDTLGRGPAAWDSRRGYIYEPGLRSVLAVSNGWIDIQPPSASSGGQTGPGRIDIGVCAPSGSCSAGARLYSEGTITAATDQAFTLGESTRYGTRNLVLALGGINVGGERALGDAAARGALPPGLTLNQSVLDRLLRGDTSTGAPALENLVFTVRDAVNFFGSTQLSTIDPATGQSTISRLMLTTPAIYGWGDTDSVARIHTDVLVWNGTRTPPGLVATNGAGTGSGRLQIDARRIELGAARDMRVDTVHDMDRLVLGFGEVQLNASEQVTARQKGSLSVYQSQGAWDEAAKGYVRTGGALRIDTPLLTGEAGSVMRYTAGGDVRVAAPQGMQPATMTDVEASRALGAEIAIDGRSVALDTAVVLPSGKLVLRADGDVQLHDGARLDLAGRRLRFFDVDKYSWGGDVEIESRTGNVRQAAGAQIDLSAQNNRAGRLAVTALGAGAGQVELLGRIAGGSSGEYDAGGTAVPYAAGRIDVRAQRLADFAGLNRRLTDGGVVGERSFQFKQGDLVVGDELKAREINLSVDGGRLTVAGTVDAGGVQVGSIRLAARDGVTIAGNALLDAHGTRLRVDSYGQAIEAPNRATIEIDSGKGRLVLESGARMDLRAGTDGAPRAFGTVELNAPRLGGARGNDIDIDAGGTQRIEGARTITVNGFFRYDDAPTGTDPDISGRPYQRIDQAYLQAKHEDSTAFMRNVLANSALVDGRLAGLRAYGDAFHLRPGVQIVSRTPDGDLQIDGDLDLSAFRYDSLNARTQRTGVYGSGEAGALVMRAGGNLKIHGSINDGFDTSALPATRDDDGWVLLKGRVPFGGDVVVPRGGVVTLAENTFLQPGRALNFQAPLKAMSLAAGTVLPVRAVLTEGYTLPAGTVLGGAVRDASGQVLHAAGTVLAQPLVLGANMQLDPGVRLAGAAKVGPMLWPVGVPLPFPDGAVLDVNQPPFYRYNGPVLAREVPLQRGAVIPAETVVVLPGGAASVRLRLADGDGNQGRNFAIAPMLAEGSQSWSMRLVAGADTQAADSRALQPRGPQRDLLLADTHYGNAFTKQLVSGGKVWSWNQQAADEGWGSLGSILTPEEVSWGMCDIGYCDLVSETPEVWDFKSYPVRQPLFSVVRTGTGDLDLLAGNDFTQRSPYGIYTAGTRAAARADDADFHLPRAKGPQGTVLNGGYDIFEQFVDSQSLYRAWYPDHGGNLRMRVQGDARGDTVGVRGNMRRTTDELGVFRKQMPSAMLGNWLWRQGTGSVVPGAEGVPTAWWINFGSYVAGHEGTTYDLGGLWPYLVGFTGIGTLGGGNLVFETGGNAGMMEQMGDHSATYVARSQGLHLAVGSTGRVTRAGELLLTGGGDLDVRIGGTLNPAPEVRAVPASTTWQAGSLQRYDRMRLDLNGVFANLRGALRLESGAVGGIELDFGTPGPKDSRALSPYVAGSSIASGGPVLIPGDAGVRLDARGDLVLGGVADPGRVPTLTHGTPFSANGTAHPGEGWTWFSLWTPSTAIDLFSAGGNLTPTLGWTDLGDRTNHQATDGRFVYPAVLRALAASGSLYYGSASSGVRDESSNGPVLSPWSLTLAPSPVGPQYAVKRTAQLELLARDSIHAAGYTITPSGADPSRLVDPFQPGFAALGGELWYGRELIHNTAADALLPSIALDGQNSWLRFPLFTLTSPSVADVAPAGQPPSRFYALEGDIVGLRTGSIVYRGSNTGVATPNGLWYEGAGPVAIRAGRDIVGAGTALGEVDLVPSEGAGWRGRDFPGRPELPPQPQTLNAASARGNLIVHRHADDVSVVEAGRDIRNSSFHIAGPGELVLSAGRELYMADKGELKSLGAIVNVKPGDRSSGAGISVAVGVGRDGPDWAGFAARYLDPKRRAASGQPFADQPGTALYSYGGELTLAGWLSQQFGYGGDEAGADAYLKRKQAEIDGQRSEGGGSTRRDLVREFGLAEGLHLVNWLRERFGGHNSQGRHFDAATMDAQAFFAALPPEQQQVYLRNVYFAELRAGGREYNEEGGPRRGSYLRGREAIATLFPAQAADGSARRYQGDLTMFSSANYYASSSDPFTKRPQAGKSYLRRDAWTAAGRPSDIGVYDALDAGIHTNFGGNVNILVPGGRTLVGVDGGFVPGEGSGVLTQGAGEVQIYSLDSILLGQSRIFTTFGGGILAWSAQGDINAGRGSKSTVVYTPQRRLYDDAGNVSLSPTTPNTGAGIATLNPIPEVPPGDIDLIAPLGTIDAGEAGIRVSGNVNLAALRVANAENIQVQGKSTGVPVVAAVNVGALTNASAAASQAATAAQDAVQRDRAAQRQALPSVFTVRVLGFGNEPAGGEGGEGGGNGAGRERSGAAYDPKGVVQVLGAGALTTAQMQSLTPGEQRGLKR